MPRRYPLGDIKILWALAAGRCCFPGCRQICIADGPPGEPRAVIGDIAHIVAHSPTGPRGDPNFPRDGLDTYDNWILLCPTHHRIVDAQSEHYDTAVLHLWRQDHESWVAAQLGQPRPTPRIEPAPVTLSLYRVAGASEDPWQPVSPSGWQTYRRWDDPMGRYAVRYATDAPDAAIAELTSQFQPAPGLLERMSEFFGEPITERTFGLDTDNVIKDVLRGRVLAQATVRGTFADLRDPEVRRYVDSRLEPLLGPKDSAMSTLGEARWTQQASRALFEGGRWDGIVYPSRTLKDHSMYALFDSATVTTGPVRPLDH